MGIVILENMFAISCYFCFHTRTNVFGSSLLVEFFFSLSSFCSHQLPSFREGVYSVQRKLNNSSRIERSFSSVQLLFWAPGSFCSYLLKVSYRLH